MDVFEFCKEAEGMKRRLNLALQWLALLLYILGVLDLNSRLSYLIYLHADILP
jgi:hypothetical protein